MSNPHATKDYSLFDSMDYAIDIQELIAKFGNAGLQRNDLYSRPNYGQENSVEIEMECHPFDPFILDNISSISIHQENDDETSATEIETIIDDIENVIENEETKENEEIKQPEENKETKENKETQTETPQNEKSEMDILDEKLAAFIENCFAKDPDVNEYIMTKYTLFEIDGVQCNISIHKENNNRYYYRFISKNIEYDIDDDNEIEDSEVILLERDDFDEDGILPVLRDIRYVREKYKFMDNYLLSPEEYQEAKLQREFIPLPDDKLCSVCYEPTIEYTICKHNICLKCREKCIAKGNKVCPICRKSELRYYPSELSDY